MALIGNYSVLNKTAGRWQPGSATAHASGAGQNPGACASSWARNSDWAKFGLQDRSGGDGTGAVVKLAAKPTGAYAPVAWALPVTEGAMSSHSLAIGSSTAALSLASGINIAGQADGTSTAEATLQLVVSMQGTAAGSSTATGNIVASLSASGSAAGSSTASATISAIAWCYGQAEGTSTASLVSYATGMLQGSISPFTELSPEGLAQAVWNSMLASYPDAGTAGNTLAMAGSGGVDVDALAQAIAAAIIADPSLLTVPKFLGLK